MSIIRFRAVTFNEITNRALYGSSAIRQKWFELATIESISSGSSQFKCANPRHPVAIYPVHASLDIYTCTTTNMEYFNYYISQKSRFANMARCGPTFILSGRAPSNANFHPPSRPSLHSREASGCNQKRHYHPPHLPIPCPPPPLSLSLSFALLTLSPFSSSLCLIFSLAQSIRPFVSAFLPLSCGRPN